MPPPVLYYVRHGETDWNAGRRLQGQSDTPLNDSGRAQARRCGEILRGLLA
ncbi:MAG: histidine phosphatase family protein, partial [Xanthobacteraceae bacterium]